MRKILVALFLINITQAWGGQIKPSEQAKKMAKAACLYQYEVIRSRFTLGLSEENAIQIPSKILEEYLVNNKQVMGEYFFYLLRKNMATQLHELEANQEVIQNLKSPPPDFKENFLSSCIDAKKKQLESMHVFE